MFGITGNTPLLGGIADVGSAIGLGGSNNSSGSGVQGLNGSLNLNNYTFGGGPTLDPSQIPAGSVNVLQQGSNPATNIPQSQPQSTNTGGGGGGGGGSSGGGLPGNLMSVYNKMGWNDPNSIIADYLANPSKYNNYLSSIGQAAAGATQAQIQAATDMYNNLKSQIEARKGDVQNAYNTGIADLDNQFAQAQTDSAQQKSDLSNTSNQALGQAGLSYQTQLGNANRLAGAFGGLNSGLIQSENQIGNWYGNTVGSIQNDLQGRQQQIDSTLTNMANNVTNQKSAMAQQLQQGILKISLDANATDFQKADAINQIQSQFNSKMADLDSQFLSFQQQMALAQQQTNQYLAAFGRGSGATSGYNPLAYISNAPQPASTNYTDYANQSTTSPLSGSDLNKTGVLSGSDLNNILRTAYPTG